MAKNENSTICAALAYLLIGIIWYFVDEKQRRDDFVKFHVHQAVALWILAVIVAIVNMVVGWIPVIGWVIALVLSVGLLILWLIGLIGALQGKKSEMPVVGGMAKSFNF